MWKLVYCSFNPILFRMITDITIQKGLLRTWDLNKWNASYDMYLWHAIIFKQTSNILHKVKEDHGLMSACLRIEGPTDHLSHWRRRRGPPLTDKILYFRLLHLRWLHHWRLHHHAADCMDECFNLATCNSFTYNIPNKQCYLKPGIYETLYSQHNIDWTGGPKSCTWKKRRWCTIVFHLFQ